jgi:hypothetical protein
MSVALLLAQAARPASAHSVPDAEAALARQQGQLRDVLGLDCGRARASNEIVVCGRRERSPYRLPFDPDPEPGARSPGEAMDQRKVLELNPKPCPVSRPRPKSDGLDLLAMAATAAVIAAHVADPEREKAKSRTEKNCG